MKKNGFAPLIIIIIIASIFIGGYFLIKNGSVAPPSPTVIPSQTNPPLNQKSLFTGKLTRLDQDLKLFKETEDMKLNSSFSGFTYYSAGKFISGNLSGYTRIIALAPMAGPGFTPIYTLATKDYKTFILDDPEGLASKYAESDYESPYLYLDKTKIASTAVFESEHSNIIPLDNHYSLYFDYILNESVKSSSKDKFNQDIYETIIPTNFSSFQKLPSPNNLTLYFKPEPSSSNKYILGNTKIYVVDSTGLPKVYSLTTPVDALKYKSDLSKFNVEYKKYQDDLKRYSNKETSKYPDSPKYVVAPHIGFSGSDIKNNSDLNFYKDYETAFPKACANGLDSMVVDVKDEDLEQIGSVNELTLYRLKNSESEVNNLQFESKMGAYQGVYSSEFEIENPGVTKPSSLSDYVKNNPLLFVKDFWNRYVAVGEWDIKLPGGCGKPVIYLYPQKDTQVTVRFGVPVSFDTDIPAYNSSWNVLAHKDGTLNNLITEPNCNKYNGLTFGSEYAKNACQINTYPYLYWSGNIQSVEYPKIDQGWFVANNNLSNFIDSKLLFMGMNQKERNDFESYWIPEMLEKSSPYYRVSFLTTQSINKMFPMTITPTPDSIFRIFMDWEPLNNKPLNELQPQILEKINRYGFTMIEWGGLKIP